MHVLALEIAGVRLQARVKCRRVSFNIQVLPGFGTVKRQG